MKKNKIIIVAIVIIVLLGAYFGTTMFVISKVKGEIDTQISKMYEKSGSVLSNIEYGNVWVNIFNLKTTLKDIIAEFKYEDTNVNSSITAKKIILDKVDITSEYPEYMDMTIQDIDIIIDGASLMDNFKGALGGYRPLNVRIAYESDNDTGDYTGDSEIFMDDFFEISFNMDLSDVPFASLESLAKETDEEMILMTFLDIINKNPIVFNSGNLTIELLPQLVDRISTTYFGADYKKEEVNMMLGMVAGQVLEMTPFLNNSSKLALSNFIKEQGKLAINFEPEFPVTIDMELITPFIYAPDNIADGAYYIDLFGIELTQGK